MKPACKLTHYDGNVFSIIGRIDKTLKRNGMIDEAHEFISRAMSAGSYDEVLQIAMEYVDIE